MLFYDRNMMKCFNSYTIVLFTTVPILIYSNFPFESCYDYGSQPVGNCTVLYNAGAIGAESVNHVLIKNGYLDYGPYWSGCPFKNNTCPTGFSYYGWVMFKAYPETCDDYGVIASTEVFNIHLLGNGHLAVYAWLPSGTEYYAETIEPMMLNIFYPIVIQFQYFSSNNSWVLSVVAQSQLLGWALFGRPRTYVPPNLNLLFGGSGNGLHSHNATIQIDRTTLDFMPRDLSYIYQVTMDVLLRQSYCTGLYGVQTQSMTCYYVQRWVNLNWTNAYKTCEQNAFTYGYSYGRLAWFPPWNVSLWKSLEPRLAYYGNDSTTGYTAWIGGGKKLQWLDESMVQVGVGATVPENITFEASNSTNSSCLQVDTRKMPWKWSETDCNKEQPFICQMSFDCLVINPCKNLGVCLPHNDGTNICKCWPGTSGQFCEKGIPSVNCVNNCTCPSPFPADICSSCLNETSLFLKTTIELKYRWKLALLNNTFDAEMIEDVECNVTWRLQDYHDKLQKMNRNITAVCDELHKFVLKMVTQLALIQNYIKHNITTGPMPQNVFDLVKLSNETHVSFTSTPCIAELIEKFKTNPEYHSFLTF